MKSYAARAAQCFHHSFRGFCSNRTSDTSQNRKATLGLASFGFIGAHIFSAHESFPLAACCPQASKQLRRPAACRHFLELLRNGVRIAFFVGATPGLLVILEQLHLAAKAHQSCALVVLMDSCRLCRRPPPKGSLSSDWSVASSPSPSFSLSFAFC